MSAVKRVWQTHRASCARIKRARAPRNDWQLLTKLQDPQWHPSPDELREAQRRLDVGAEQRQARLNLRVSA